MKLVWGMSKLPDAAPIPDKPPLSLKGGCLCVASPVDFSEACFSIPAMRALKQYRPMGSLVIYCPEILAPLWKTVSGIDDIIVYPDRLPVRRMALLVEDSDYNFDSAIIWESGDAAKALAKAGIVQRLGYPARKLAKYLTDAVSPVVTPGPIEHRVRHYLNFVQELGADAYVRGNFQHPPLPPAPEQCRIAVASTSEYGAAYDWPSEKFDEVKNLIETRHGQVEWVMLESSIEARLQQLGQCSALLACDGDAAHLAAHLGLPAVVVFGPGEPDWKRPLGKQSRVVREHVACSPCYLPRCPLDHRCQQEVTAEQVADELELALADR